MRYTILHVLLVQQLGKRSKLSFPAPSNVFFMVRGVGVALHGTHDEKKFEIVHMYCRSCLEIF